MIKKITNQDVQSLMILYNKKDNLLNGDEISLPIKILWAIENNIQEIKKIYNNILEIRQKIENEYMSDDKSEEIEGGRIVKKEYLSEFSSKINELNSIENNIDFLPVYIEDLENLSLTGEDFQMIKLMITSKEREEK